MEEANTLAHYDKTTITAIKSFIVQAPELYFVLTRMEYNFEVNIFETWEREIKKNKILRNTFYSGLHYKTFNILYTFYAMIS